MVRWTKPEYGETREVTKFLLIPRLAKNLDKDTFEWRWLERVTIHQRYLFNGWGDMWFVD